METAKLTVRLPKRDLEFAKEYAQAHRITVTELIDRYLNQVSPWRSRGNPLGGRADLGPRPASGGREGGIPRARPRQAHMRWMLDLNSPGEGGQRRRG